MNFEQIFKNNEKWIAEKTQQNPAYFQDLSKGQKPEILYIGCSDSRVTAEDLMGAQPGELFIHRNVANMVVSIDLNVMSVINYAVTHLKVKHVVVCGHYECGGVSISSAFRHGDIESLAQKYQRCLQNTSSRIGCHNRRTKKIRSIGREECRRTMHQCH